MKIQSNGVSLVLTGLLSLVGAETAFARPIDDVATPVSDRGDRGVKPKLAIQIDESDRNDFSKIKIPCNDKTAELGMRKCAAVKKDAKKYVRAVMGHVIHHYYDGKILQFDDQKGFCIQETFPAASIPICSVLDKDSPEIDKNRKGEACAGPLASNANKGYCAFPIASDFSTCGFETSWLRRGSRVQTWEHHLEEVEKNIDDGEITLVDFSADPTKPARMCEGYAKAIKNLIYGKTRPGANYADAFIRQNFPALALNTEVAKACGTQATASLVGDTTASVTASRDPAATDPAAGATMNNISSAACHLTAARANIEALFYKLAACEAYYRGTKTYFETFEHSQMPWTTLSSEVVEPCLAHARSATGSSENKTSDSAFMEKFYACYRGEVAGKKGAKDSIKGVLDAYAPTDEAAPYKDLGGVMKDCVIADASGASNTTQGPSPASVPSHPAPGGSHGHGQQDE